MVITKSSPVVLAIGNECSSKHRHVADSLALKSPPKCTEKVSHFVIKWFPVHSTVGFADLLAANLSLCEAVSLQSS